MRHPASFSIARDPLPDHEQKQAALELPQRGLGGSAARRRRRRLPGAGEPVHGAGRTGLDLWRGRGGEIRGRSACSREERRVFAGAGEAVDLAPPSSPGLGDKREAFDAIRPRRTMQSQPSVMLRVTCFASADDNCGWDEIASYAFNVSRNRTGSPVDGVVTSPCHITRLPRTKVPTGQPVTRTPS
mgnify:CR=1 FL=1